MGYWLSWMLGGEWRWVYERDWLDLKGFGVGWL